MIISSVTNATFNGSGSTGPFTFTFFFFQNSDLTVTKKSVSGVTTMLQLNTDYTVTGAGSSGGGAITLTTALQTGETLTVQRVTPTLQLTALQNQGAFFAPTIEQSLDRLTMIAQELQGIMSQVPQVAFYNDVGGSGKRAAIQMRYMGLDANGNDMWQLEVITV